MADKIELGGMSKEEVALQLLKYVSYQESKDLGARGSGADRAYILSTYYECWQVAHGIKPK